MIKNVQNLPWLVSISKYIKIHLQCVSNSNLQAIIPSQLYSSTRESDRGVNRRDSCTAVNINFGRSAGVLRSFARALYTSHRASHARIQNAHVILMLIPVNELRIECSGSMQARRCCHHHANVFMICMIHAQRSIQFEFRVWVYFICITRINMNKSSVRVCLYEVSVSKRRYDFVTIQR